MLSYLAIGFNLVVCFGVPLGALVWLIVRHRHLVLPYLAGLMAFLVSQNLTRIPLLGWLGRQVWFVQFYTVHPVAYGLALAFTAGLFEEVGRYIAMRLMARYASRPKRCLSFPGALAFGVGHGGFEAIYIGYMYLTQIFAVPAALIAAASPLDVALPGIERMMTMMIHIGLSVMVMRGAAQSRRAPRLLWLLAAIAVHTAVDASITLLPLWGFDSIWAIEACVAVCALVLAVFTVLSRHKIIYQPVQSTAPITEEAPHEEEN